MIRSFLIFLAIMVPAVAADTAATPWLNQEGRNYVLNAVRPPPETGSDKEKADLEGLKKAQAEAGKAKFSSPLEGLSAVIGPDFTAARYPVTFQFLDAVLKDEQELTRTAQERFKRKSPAGTTGLYSFPDNQAADSRMLVLLLTPLFPEKTNALLERDELVAQQGIESGLFYPSDLVAGRNVAHVLLFVIQDNPAFTARQAEAKAEIAKVAADKKTAK